ncbi:DUF2958 domain-containing protein [Eubacteriales bacterium OttesenSCG-928-N13]|nr:DUF2958 domain-containing protein [Eubacteriales bacterium OttesenSCG-928-N13]
MAAQKMEGIGIMKLITKQIEKRLAATPLYNNEKKGLMLDDYPVLVKYFNPCGAGTWLITEAEKQDNGDWLLYGLAHIREWEWGFVLLSELENVQLPWGLRIERDPHIGNNVTIKDFDTGWKSEAS